MNKDKLKQAIRANFACNKVNLKCTDKLEDSVDAGLAFYENLSNGKDESLLKLFNQLIKTNRYKRKMKLIEKYLAIMCLCLMLTSCFTGKSAVDYHQGLQSHYNFEAAMKRNTGFTLKGAKDQLKDAKADARDQAKKEKHQEKIDDIREKIEELKRDNQ